MSQGPDTEVDVDEEAVKRIRERVLEAEKKQLHLKRPHGIIPEIQQIVEEEVD
jgi:hypothetical protein